MSKTHEQFVKEIQEKFGDVYNIYGKYVRADVKMQVQHKCKDGDWFTWNVTPSNLLHGKGLCPKCSGKSKGIEEFKRKVFKLEGNNYIVTGEYKGSLSPIKMKHNIKDCQYEFPIDVCAFLYVGTRCPKCSPISRGEACIEDNFNINLINYEKQYTFSDCKYKHVLRFDFAVFEDLEKTKLKYLIEYQGNQHYKPQTFHGISKERAIIEFGKQNIKDKIKVDYCIKNNIELLTIPYWDFDNIEMILNNVN